MKINAVRSKLLGGINAVKDVVKGEDEANPFRYVKLETLGTDSALLTGSNGDVQVTSRVFCEVGEAGRCALAGAYLTRFVGALDEGALGIVLDGSRARIEGAGAKFSLALGDVDAFPVMPGPDPSAEGTRRFTVPCATLAGALDSTRFAASTDRTRASCCGVNFSSEGGWLHLCGLDGRRLALASVDLGLDDGMSATVPNAAVAVVSKLLQKFGEGDVDVHADERSVRFTASLWSVTAKLIEAGFPPFRRAIPEKVANEVVFDRELFLNRLEQAALGCWGGGSRHVKMVLDANEASFEARSAVSFAASGMPVRYDAGKATFLVDPDLLASVVSRTSGNEFRMGFTDQASPLRVACDVPYTGVVMPVREV